MNALWDIDHDLLNPCHASSSFFVCRLAMRGEFAPIFVVLGMLMVAMTIGAHTAKQHLMHSPGVRVSKKKRESFPEVEDPDNVISSADKFVNKSFLRKVAHIQDHKRVIPDPTRPNPFTRCVCFIHITSLLYYTFFTLQILKLLLILL